MRSLEKTQDNYKNRVKKLTKLRFKFHDRVSVSAGSEVIKYNSSIFRSLKYMERNKLPRTDSLQLNVFVKN